MPAKSKSQLRLLFAKERRGELPPGTAKHWAHETPNIKALPERLHPVRKKKRKKRQHLQKSAFWQGFFKRADDNGMGDGGNGFTGVGKNNILGSLEHDEYNGSKPAYDEKPDGASDGMTDKSLLDRERNPRDFSPFNNGPELEDENGTHVIY